MRSGLGFLLSFFACAALGASAPALTPLIGDPAAPLVLKDPKGVINDLARFRGQVVLVNFWATWCEPCRQEMPSIQRLRERLAGKPFAVLAVNVDEPEARVRQFLTKTQLELPVLLDSGKTVTRGWAVRVLPTSFLVGPDGRARYRVIGDIDWSNDTIVGVVTQLMNGG